MPLTLRNRRSSKSLPKFKAPARKSMSSFDLLNRGKRSLEKRVPKVTMKLVDKVTSSLSKDGNWYTVFGDNAESGDVISLQQAHEKLIKDKEQLAKRHEVLLDLARDKVEQLDKLEKEHKQLCRILKKNPRNCDKVHEENRE